MWFMKLNKKITESLIAIFHPNTVGFVESSANSFEKFNKIQYKLQKIFSSTNVTIGASTLSQKEWESPAV